MKTVTILEKIEKEIDKNKISSVNDILEILKTKKVVYSHNVELHNDLVLHKFTYYNENDVITNTFVKPFNLNEVNEIPVELLNKSLLINISKDKSLIKEIKDFEEVKKPLEIVEEVKEIKEEEQQQEEKAEQLTEETETKNTEEIPEVEKPVNDKNLEDLIENIKNDGINIKEFGEEVVVDNETGVSVDEITTLENEIIEQEKEYVEDSNDVNLTNDTTKIIYELSDLDKSFVNDAKDELDKAFNSNTLKKELLSSFFKKLNFKFVKETFVDDFKQPFEIELNRLVEKNGNDKITLLFNYAYSLFEDYDNVTNMITSLDLIKPVLKLKLLIILNLVTSDFEFNS